eukprot:NODE_270_length_11220_cov_0.981387.p4 type:complete len:246 gc:universal NODE_270_length_11220_cov_0.981387:8975-9712(+)
MDDTSSQFSLDIPAEIKEQFASEDNIEDIIEMLESRKTQKQSVYPRLLGYLISASEVSHPEDLVDIILKERLNEFTARSLAILYLFTDHGLRDSINYLFKEIQGDYQKSIAHISAAFIVFIASEDEESTLKLIALLQSKCKRSEKYHKSYPQSLISALTSIFVLSTTIEDEQFINLSKDLIPDLVFYAENDNLELSLGCAEILAFIFQKYQTLGVFNSYVGRLRIQVKVESNFTNKNGSYKQEFG